MNSVHMLRTLIVFMEDHITMSLNDVVTPVLRHMTENPEMQVW